MSSLETPFQICFQDNFLSKIKGKISSAYIERRRQIIRFDIKIKQLNLPAREIQLFNFYEIWFCEKF